MENVVPSSLQRLRVSDVIRMAGLNVAALGQEYFRLGAVHHTQRQGARLSGIVDVPTTRDVSASFAAIAAEKVYASTSVQHYTPEIEVQSSTAWKSTCSCGMNIATVCAHAAALLYQWLARPATFSSSVAQVSLPSPVSLTSVPSAPSNQFGSLSEDEMTMAVGDGEEHAEHSADEAPLEAKSTPPFAAVGTGFSASVSRRERGPSPLTNLHDILGQMSLSELRNLARVYDLITNGMSKQQLVDTFLETLGQPELVRRVATTLEKPQRQLLAALTLAGGSMTDDDLRGLFERFSLGQPGQLQSVLLTLQSKALLFRTSLNSTPQQRIGLSGSLLDVGWYVPIEVRNALRVTVPITTIDVQHANERGEIPRVHEGKPYRLLADLLVVARALDGYGLERILEHDDQENEDARTHSSATLNTTRAATAPATLASDGSMPLPPPADLPSGALLAALEITVGRSRALLRFAIRLLRLADILHKDDGGTPYLRVLAQTARLLLGPAHAEIARDLFELWLTQSAYEDVYDLQEDGVRVRCRATALHQPMMRMSELEAENSEARQELVALLAQVPLKQWISFSAFARFVYRLNPAFLQRRQRLFSLPHWWLEYEEGRALRPTQFNDWLRGEYHYLARLLRGSLHWWGACDIAVARDGRLVGFRLTSMAGWLFHGLPFDEHEEAMGQNALTKLAHVTEKGELLVESTAQAWPMLQLLEEFAEVAGVKEGKLCYRLAPAALSSAISKGKQPELLLELLRALLDTTTQDEGQALSSLLTQVERWIANYGRIRFYTNVAMLEVADTVVMRELNATTALDEQVVRSLHPTLHILKRPGAERLIDDLKRRGQMPLLHDEDVYGAE